MLSILFLGDVMGRSGRSAVKQFLPQLIERYRIDLTIANVENAARGFGVTENIVKDLQACGVDVMTLGNHTWDQREILGWIASRPNVLRPMNYPSGAPGRGTYVAATRSGAKVLVASAMGRVFMGGCLDDPFSAVEAMHREYPLGASIQASLLDFHAESTSETMAMGHFCDGKMSVVVGTHTHVPTADVRVLSGGTAYQSDVGMTGDYDSVIGMQVSEPLRRFRTGMNLGKFEPASGEATLCGLCTRIDTNTGLACETFPIRVGGVLSEAGEILI